MMSQLVQHSLNDLLRYWAYNSLSSTSPQAIIRGALRGMPGLLRNCISAFREANIALPESVAQDVEDLQSQRSFAEIFAKLNRAWDDHVPRSNHFVDLPKSQHYDQWYSKGGHDKRFWPVHKLRENLKASGLFSRAIVHGSVSTLDDVSGFSDLDLALIVRTETLTDPVRLQKFRRLAADVLSLTFAFDPFMHHGPYFISETDLRWYPDAHFPGTLFEYGVDLFAPDQLRYAPRDCCEWTDSLFDLFERFFREWKRPCEVRDGYEVEWFLGNVMILPALYLQRKTATYRYKRDTFIPASLDFSPEEWEPIKIATELRSELPPRSKPAKWMVNAARLLRFPGLLQRHARRSAQSLEAARRTTDRLGPDFSDRVLHLITLMKSRSQHHEPSIIQ